MNNPVYEKLFAMPWGCWNSVFLEYLYSFFPGLRSHSLKLPDAQCSYPSRYMTMTFFPETSLNKHDLTKIRLVDMEGQNLYKLITLCEWGLVFFILSIDINHISTKVIDILFHTCIDLVLCNFVSDVHSYRINEFKTCI